jgi:hypothetical protein
VQHQISAFSWILLSNKTNNRTMYNPKKKCDSVFLMLPLESVYTLDHVSSNCHSSTYKTACISFYTLICTNTTYIGQFVCSG